MIGASRQALREQAECPDAHAGPMRACEKLVRGSPPEPRDDLPIDQGVQSGIVGQALSHESNVRRLIYHEPTSSPAKSLIPAAFTVTIPCIL